MGSSWQPSFRRGPRGPPGTRWRAGGMSVRRRTVGAMRPVTDLQRSTAPLEVVSEYQPAGDQPTAIAELTERLNAGEKDVRAEEHTSELQSRCDLLCR